MREDWPQMRAGQARQRAFLGRGIVQVHAQGHDAVVRVRPRGRVLVPLHDLARPGPFVIQLAAMEFHVRPHQIGRDIGQRRFGREAPEIGMPIHEGTQASDVGRGGGVERAEVERLVRRGPAAALVEEFRRQLPQPGEPFRRHQTVGGEEPVAEIRLALRPRQHAGGMREDGFGRHGGPAVRDRRTPRTMRRPCRRSSPRRAANPPHGTFRRGSRTGTAI